MRGRLFTGLALDVAWLPRRASSDARYGHWSLPCFSLFVVSPAVRRFSTAFLLALISMVSLMPNRDFFCLRFRSGRCGAGAKCKFGHGGAELRPRPRSRSPLRVMEEGELDGADPPSGLPVVKEEGEVSESEAEEERGTHWVWTADPVASAAQRRPVGSLQLVPK